MENGTIIGFCGLDRHRSMTIKKVTNGYVMKAKVNREVAERGEFKRHMMADEETYVFYTLEELIKAVETYFKVDKKDLNR